MGPVIDELRILWNGVPNTYDAHCKELFNLKAMLLWTMMVFSCMLFVDLFFFAYSNDHRLRKPVLISKSSNRR